MLSQRGTTPRELPQHDTPQTYRSPHSLPFVHCPGVELALHPERGCAWRSRPHWIGLAKKNEEHRRPPARRFQATTWPNGRRCCDVRSPCALWVHRCGRRGVDFGLLPNDRCGRTGSGTSAGQTKGPSGCKATTLNRGATAAAARAAGTCEARSAVLAGRWCAKGQYRRARPERCFGV